jgi:cellulose synthase/poly-beta-1,6-N-acetylglucosamine synthase-like glycosyltransferase
MICQIAFWTSLLLMAYTFIGYQLLVRLLAIRSSQRRPVDEAQAGRVAVLIVAHDEEARIRGRIENLLATPMALDIVVCCDGSTDATAAIARDAGARVVEFPIRRGKAACLSDALPGLDAEVVVLADCRQCFTAQTIPRLARHFGEPSVGAVSGILRIGAPGTSAGAGVDLYWKMETAIRQAESDIDSCIGCTGAVYAIRRPLFRPIPSDTILDDVVIPMEIALSGFRIVYDNQAEAFDPQPLDPCAETLRKTRTLAGNFQMLLRYPGWLLPWRNRLAWQLISHKYLRLAGPFLLGTILGSSLFLVYEPFFRACVGAQLIAYLLAGAGLAIPSLRMRLFSIPAGFLFLNWTAVRGFFRFLWGPAGGAWDRAGVSAAEPENHVLDQLV